MNFQKIAKKICKCFARVGAATVITTILMAVPTLAATFNLTVNVPSGYSDTDSQAIYIEGLKYERDSSDADAATVTFEGITIPEDKKPQMAVMYRNNDSGKAKFMTVWKITYNEDGTTAVSELSYFKDFLRYEGYQVRYEDTSKNLKNGLRVITSINKTAREALISDEGYNGYKLVEYGNLQMPQTYADDIQDAYDSGLEAGKCDFTLDGRKAEFSSGGKTHYYPEAAIAYGDDNGTFRNQDPLDDPRLSDSSKFYFSATLVDLKNYNAEKHYRGYAKIKDESGNEFVLYSCPESVMSIFKVVKNLSTSSMSDAQKGFVNEVKNTCKYNGAKMLFIGESIMMGSIGVPGTASAYNGRETFSENRLPVAIPKMLKERYSKMDKGLTVYGAEVKSSPSGDGKYEYFCDYAKGGSTYTIAKSVTGSNMMSFAKKALGNGEGQDNLKPDIVMIMGGTNDWWFSEQGPFGSLNEDDGSVKVEDDYPAPNSYCWNVYDTFKYILDCDSNPELVVVLPPQAIVINNPSEPASAHIRGSEHANSTTFRKFPAYLSTQAAIANYLNNQPEYKGRVHVIDMYSGWYADGVKVEENSSNFWRLLPDGVHMTDYGYKSFSEGVFDKLINF